MFKTVMAMMFALNVSFAEENPVKEIAKASVELFGTEPQNKFSIYQPNYFVFGKENLKMQFSGKYRVAKTYNLYLGYTQTMFWNIYADSAPFDDINYNPEVFYRIRDKSASFLKSVDLGIQHTSNGEDGEKSRSINRLYVKSNFVTKYKRNSLLGELKIQNIYSKSDANKDIVDYMGFWELRLTVTHLIVIGTGRIDSEIKMYSGKSIVNLGKGGREAGIVYHVGSENFNPAIYLQYFSGYAESLLHYNQKSNQARLGLLLFF